MIEHYGWSDALRQDFMPFAAEGLSPARVIIQQRGRYRLIAQAGELDAELAGRFTFEAAEGDYPVTGDWVAASVRAGEGAATIRAVLPRRSQFVRKAAGPEARPQIVAANVDVALLVASLNGDLSPRRLERYLAAAWESGALPFIVLTKADMCDDVVGLTAEVERVALGVPVHAVSAVTGEGLGAVEAAIGKGRTAVLLGSSGVGKSTLVNALAGAELMATQAIREDDARGRHTTTHRELVLLPGGGLMLDTPGMRELGLWDADEGLAAAFGDIEAIAAECRFHDCGHNGEPGCAIRAAIKDGSLAEERWQNYGKLQRELAHERRKENYEARQAHKKLWMGRHKAYRQMKKFQEREG